MKKCTKEENKIKGKKGNEKRKREKQRKREKGRKKTGLASYVRQK